jgi:carbon storage regulator
VSNQNRVRLTEAQILNALHKQRAFYADTARRGGEPLIVDNEVNVTVHGIKGNQLRLGINASKSVQVHHQEVFDRIKRQRSLNTTKSTSTWQDAA